MEQVPLRDFKPPFCPWPNCTAHRPTGNERFHYHRHGVYLRRCHRRNIPRFRCLHCRKTFSQQSFSTTYYLKRPELLRPIAAGLQAGSAHRQIARSLRCAPSTVTRQSARLGRHAILLQALALQWLEAIQEPIVYDDFESFAFCQDRPFGMGTAVGQRSWFVYSLQFAPHRRGGGRRAARRRRAANRPAAERGAYRRAFRRTLELLLAKLPPQRQLKLISDGHLGYRSGLRDHPRRHAVRHHVFPNPPRGPKGAPRSARARLRDRQMFPVDLLHSLMRHSLAHHRRETIAFGRRHNALMERGFLMLLWRNFIKARSERRSDAPTPAMVLDLARTRWSWSRALAQRLFASRIRLPETWSRVYRRELLTPEVGHNHRHRLVQAF